MKRLSGRDNVKENLSVGKPPFAVWLAVGCLPFHLKGKRGDTNRRSPFGWRWVACPFT